MLKQNKKTSSQAGNLASGRLNGFANIHLYFLVDGFDGDVRSPSL